MRNEILFLLTTALTFVGTLGAFFIWGKKGIYAWIAFASVVVNIEVVKCVDLFGMSVTLGNILYGSTFLCTDILSENYGGRESRKAVAIGFFFQVTFTVLSQLSMSFIPNWADFSNDAFHIIFDIMPRICFASFLAFFVSNTLDTYLYEWIAKRTEKIWIRNNGSTIFSQFVDTTLFTILAFWGVFDYKNIIELTATTYMIKILVAVFDTPFAYLGKYIYSKRKDKW